MTAQYEKTKPYMQLSLNTTTVAHIHKMCLKSIPNPGYTELLIIFKRKKPNIIHSPD